MENACGCQIINYSIDSIEIQLNSFDILIFIQSGGGDGGDDIYGKQKWHFLSLRKGKNKSKKSTSIKKWLILILFIRMAFGKQSEFILFAGWQAYKHLSRIRLCSARAISKNDYYKFSTRAKAHLNKSKNCTNKETDWVNDKKYVSLYSQYSSVCFFCFARVFLFASRFLKLF